MKTKTLVQILAITIICTGGLQAQDNINREVKKDLRKAKRELRKSKKEIKKTLEDFHVDAIHLGEIDLDDRLFDVHGDHGRAMILLDGKLDDLEDVMADLEVELKDLEFVHELAPLEHIMELEQLEKLDHLDVDIPEMIFATPKLDIRAPKVYRYRSFYPEAGSVLELSKELEDVSVSKDFYFEIDEGSNSLDMNIEGTLNSGDLTIKVTKPDGEVFQTFQISPLADVDWNQQIDLNEAGEVYKGKWTINLKGTGATGNYSLKFRTK